MYMKSVQETLDRTGPDEPLRTIYKVRQNYFTVYESNSAILGRLPDAELKAILRAYSEVKSLIDTHYANSDLYDRYEMASSREKIHVGILMKAYAPVVREVFATTKAAVADAQKVLGQSHPSN
jgi:hypothetical protein